LSFRPPFPSFSCSLSPTPCTLFLFPVPYTLYLKPSNYNDNKESQTPYFPQLLSSSSTQQLISFYLPHQLISLPAHQLLFSSPLTPYFSTSLSAHQLISFYSPSTNSTANQLISFFYSSLLTLFSSAYQLISFFTPHPSLLTFPPAYQLTSSSASILLPPTQQLISSSAFFTPHSSLCFHQLISL